MARPTGSDMHVDVPLTNLTIGYRNSGYIADDIFPVINVEKQSDLFYIWEKDYWFRNYVQQRAPGTEYPEAEIDIASDSYFTPIYNLAYPINDEDWENADEQLELESTAAEWLADQFVMNREDYMVNNFFKTGVWGKDITGVSSAPGTNQFRQWNDYANSDPEKDMREMIREIQKKTGIKPNKFIMGPEVMDVLKEHSKLVEKYKYSQISILDESEVMEAMRAPMITVGEAIMNTADEGSDFSGSFMWGKNACLMYVAPGPGRRVASAGYTFMWDVGTGSGAQVRIESVRDELRDRDLKRGKHAFVHKVTGKDLAVFFGAAVS